ncbi:MAG: WD40 repeat domain-containing protein, partial [Candidatus Electrothrix sp. AU1_5]|nr:WD40 repeat domain-containing protein [Candidatus Electrothrix gigas]
FRYQGGVASVAFSPDGKTLASASFDKTVRLWDTASGQQINVFKGHQDSVFSVAFSPDGKTLASASLDKTVRLWDLASGKEKNVFKGHQDGVFSVAFSPDGKTLASASLDKTVRLWDLASGKEKNVFRGHQGEVASVAFSPDGKTLASASEDETVRLWNNDALFLDKGRATPLYRSFMNGLQFLWQVKLDGLEFVPADYKRTRTLYAQEDDNFIYDPKFRLLLNPPPPGQSKFEQVLEWAQQQQEK